MWGMGNTTILRPGVSLTATSIPRAPTPTCPWGGEPTGALIAPLVLLAMVYSRKKRRGKLDMLIILLVLCVGVGMTLSACNFTRKVPGGTVEGTLAPTSESTATPPTSTSTPIPSYKAKATITPDPGAGTPSPTFTCIATLTREPKLPFTYLDITNFYPVPGKNTDVTAEEVYKLYKELWEAPITKWWWVAFGNDLDFSIWDFISTMSYYEASRQTRFAPLMAEAGVRFYYGGSGVETGYSHDSKPENIINWWAEFSESTARIIKNGGVSAMEPANIGIPPDMAIVGEKFKESPTDWRGWDYYGPYDWGNLYALESHEINTYKQHPEALFVKWGTESEWKNNKAFVIPSGCLWKKGQSYDDPDWQEETCPKVEQMN
jgi:hypothetical protein